MHRGYREKKIICSPVYAEVDLIPVRADTHGCRGEGETNEKQQRANRKAAERHFVQLANANFVQPDVLLVDPTYAGGEEPADFAEADRNLVNYLRRISYLCARKKLPKPKYVAVTEGGAEGTGCTTTSFCWPRGLPGRKWKICGVPGVERSGKAWAA